MPTVFLQVREERRGEIALTRRMQAPVDSTLGQLKSLVAAPVRAARVGRIGATDERAGALDVQDALQAAAARAEARGGARRGGGARVEGDEAPRQHGVDCRVEVDALDAGAREVAERFLSNFLLWTKLADDNGRYLGARVDVLLLDDRRTESTLILLAALICLARDAVEVAAGHPMAVRVRVRFR